MLDQNRLQAIDEAKAEAEARKQQAISEAHEAFSRAYLAEKARHAAEYERASAAWNAVKSNPNAKDYDEPREACYRQTPRSARAELNRAIALPAKPTRPRLPGWGRSMA